MAHPTAELRKTFDANATAAADSGLFGLPFTAEDSRLHLLAVPWEVTTSYGDGAANGPKVILRASHQVDLFDIETGSVYQHGYYLHEAPADIESLNAEMKLKANRIVEAIEAGREQDPEIKAIQSEVNAASTKLNAWVYEQSRRALQAGKIPAVIGGDHSTPFGLIRAVKEKYGDTFGILHIDAHADLRDAYQGYKYSHASIMYNVIEELKPAKLVQVGIRDFSPGEYDYIKQSNRRIETYFDTISKRRLNRGESWQSICDEIVAKLPENVYISFDIDGLSPELCPSTGTPVPGGLSFDQTLALFATVAESGRKIVAFDLNEVAETEEGLSEWDGNVGARLLFKLCGWTMITNGYTAADRLGDRTTDGGL